MAFAFNMGKDVESILSNPIGQPLAKVRICYHVRQRVRVTFGMNIDIFQQLREDRNACFMGIHCDCTVYDGFECSAPMFFFFSSVHD